MTHRLSRLSCLAFLALAPALAAQTPAAGSFAPRLAAMESVLERFYRGESPEAAKNRINARVDACNAQVRQRNEEAESDRARAERESAGDRKLADDLAAMDHGLGRPPDPADHGAVQSYNQRVDARNAAVRRYNLALAAEQQAAVAGSARIHRLDLGIDQVRAQLDAEQRALKGRLDAYRSFAGQGRDVAFFTALNRLLADLRAAGRQRSDPGLQRALAQVRGYRQELARWAAAREAALDDGLVLVEAVVDDEPCCFIVDTGAQLVCLPSEIIDALGLTGSLGEESTLTLAGGQKIQGRSILLDRIAVAGASAAGIKGAAIPASEVGIDGLLGQSFLKRFVYTIDEGRPGKLTLVRRD